MVNNVVQFKNAVRPILKKAGVKSSALFGSFARGDYNKNSDIDMLVEFKMPVGLFAFSDLKTKLERELKRKVDLVSAGGVSPLIKQYINRDSVQII